MAHGTCVAGFRAIDEIVPVKLIRYREDPVRTQCQLICGIYMYHDADRHEESVGGEHEGDMNDDEWVGEM